MGVKTKGLKGKRRRLAQLRDWTSWASWYLFVMNFMSRFANQSTILCFTFFEFSCSFFAVWFYSSTKEIALNGWLITRWKAYAIVLLFRLFCSMLGFFSAWKRKIRLLRYYYAAILPNIIFSFVAMVPLKMTRCKCENFLQCQVLIAFTKDHSDFMINPHPPPNHHRWDLRAVPYDEPPPLDFATRVLRVRHDTLVLNLLNDTFDSEQRFEVNPEIQHLQYLKDFVVSNPGIHWVSKERHCGEDIIPEDAGAGSNFKKSLEALKSTRATKLSHFKDTLNDVLTDRLGHALHNCVDDPRCAVLHIVLKEGNTFRACHYDYPAVPVPASLQAVPKSAPFFSMYLQKHHSQVVQDTVNMSTYNYAAIGDHIDVMPPDEAWKKTREIFAGACRCHPHLPTPEKHGCQVWNDGRRWRSWCVIDSDSLNSCIRSGITVYKQSVEFGLDYYWSEDLCSKSGCRCARVGLPPIPNNKQVIKSNLLGNHGFNYGKSCKKWDEEDEDLWCYVGFDTTCPDRRLDIVEARLHDGKPDKVYQFHSSYACIKERQLGVMKSFQDRCQTFIASMVMTLVVLNILSLPMFIVVYKFLMNRCGDHFVVEDEFNVQFSSEDERDDFTIGEDRSSAADKLSFQTDTSKGSVVRKPSTAESDSKSEEVEKNGSEEKSESAYESEEKSPSEDM